VTDIGKDFARFTDPVVAASKFAWTQARGATIVAALGVVAWIFAFWEQILPQYSYSPGYDVPQTSYTAGGMHSLCVTLGSLNGMSASVVNVCNQAAGAEAEKGHAFLLGAFLIAAAIFWANRKYRFIEKTIDAHRPHGKDEK
jgi:hypothetical protein